VNWDLSMPPKRTVPEVASEEALERVPCGMADLLQLTNIIQVDGIQAAVDLAA
jgi:hypothetical protein